MWTPTHVIVTVLKAKNLLEKGKGGNDAYCMIGMGKEKFLTSVKQKSLSPVWEEQAEFELGERADLKITVYHKSSIIDEFVGRAVINVSELVSHDSNKSYTSWYKLGGKPEKSESSKKPEKQRGEIEVRVEFVIKPKAGSMMDLSLKNKEKSLSIKNLKSSTSNLKQSLGDKFKSLGKRKDSLKYNGENQLAEQARRMGGSKKDFLDGDDAASIYSSYSSINGPTLQRQNTDTRINSMSRFNPARSSFISKTSSKLGDADSLSKESARFNNEEENILDDSVSNNDFERGGGGGEEDANNSGGASSFQRRNSTKFSRTGSTLSRRVSGRKNSDLKLEQGIVETENVAEKEEEEEAAIDGGGLHIAPLPPFVNNSNSSTPHLQTKNPHHNEQKPPSASPKQRTNNSNSNNKHPIIDEEATLGNVAVNSDRLTNGIIKKDTKSPSNRKEKSSNKLKPPTTTTTTSSSTIAADSFASIFSASLENTLKTTNEHEHEHSISSGIASMLGKSNQKENSADASKSSSSLNDRGVIPTIVKEKKMNNKNANDDDDEEHIDWASSDEEEDLQKEFASFERNQVLRQSERRRLMPTEDLTSDLNSETDFNANNSSFTSSARKRNHNQPQHDRINMKIDFNSSSTTNHNNNIEDEIKTPDFDADYGFQDTKATKVDGGESNGRSHNGLPDLINQKGSSQLSNTNDKARKFLEGLDGVKFNEIQVPDVLKKQLEYFDRDELLQLIAYQKKYLDYKESRIKDLENYIDNLVVKIIETEPLILMNASNVLSKSSTKLI